MPDLKILKRFKISDSFFGRYERLIKDEVIPYQEMQRRILRNGFSGQRCCQMA